MSIKVVINKSFGGFSLSPAAQKLYAERTKKDTEIIDSDISRDDPELIATIETLGLKASSGEFATLKIIKIPNDVSWEIHDYDGAEWVAETHRTWNGSDDDE
jgi:hypothetical protein